MPLQTATFEAEFGSFLLELEGKVASFSKLGEDDVMLSLISIFLEFIKNY